MQVPACEGWLRFIGAGVFVASLVAASLPARAAVSNAPEGNSSSFVTTIDGSLFSDKDSYFSRVVDGDTADDFYVGTVPIPPALLLFGSGIIGLSMLGRRRHKNLKVGGTR